MGRLSHLHREGCVKHLLSRPTAQGFGESPLLLSLLNTLRLFGAGPGTLDQTSPDTHTRAKTNLLSRLGWKKGKDSRLWVQIPAPPPTSSVTLGRLFNRTEPHFCLRVLQILAVPPSEQSWSFLTGRGASLSCCWLWAVPGN